MLSVLVPRYVYAVAVMLHGQALPQELAAKACLCRLEVQHEEAGSELLQQHQEVHLEAGRSRTTTWLWVADGMLTTIADATLTVTLAVTPQKAVPFASVGDNQLHAEQQGGTKVTKTGVKFQPGMAAAVARPASAGEAGTGQKGLFSWCRKLAKRRQVASGGQEEQDNGTEQAPPSLAGKPGAGGRAASPQQPPEGKEVAGSLQRQVLQDSISLQEVLMSATLERSFELNPEGGGCLGVTVKIGAPQRGPHHLVLQRNHPGTVVVDHNLDDLVTLLPLPAKMARRTPRQSRSTHDVLHAPARVVPGAADQAPTAGLHEGLPAQHKRTGLDTMVSGAGGLGAVLEHVPAYVTFGGVQESKAGKHVPHMPVAAARHAVPESGTGQHLPLQPQSSSSRSADAVPAAGEADGLKRISFELQQPQPQQLDGLSPESSTIAQEPPAPAEQHRRSPPSLEGGPRHRAGRLSSQGSPPAVKYARLLNGVLEPDHETLQPDRKSMSLQQGMDRRQFRPLSGSAAPPSCPVTPGIHATRNSTGAAVGDGRLHSALPSRRTSADVEHAAVVRGRLGNMSLAAGVDRQQLQLAFRGLSGLDRKLLLPAHKCLAEDSFGQELGGRLDRLSASMTMPNRPSPAGHLSRQTSWSKDDTGLDVKRRASTLRPAVPSAEDPVTGQPCLDFELRLSDEATCSGPALARCSQGDGGTVVISCWQDASWRIWAMLQRPADDNGVQHTAVLMQDEAVGHWTCKQVQGSLAAGSSRPGPALVWQWVAPGATGKHAVSTADAQGSAAALLGHRGAQLPEAGAQGGGRPSWLGSLCRRAGPDTVSDPSSSGTAGAAQAKAAPAHPPPRQGPLAQLGVWPAEMRHPTTESRRESRASRRPTSSRRQSGTGGDPFLEHALSGDRMLSKGGVGGSGKLRPSDGRVTDQLSEAHGMQQPCELTVEFEEPVSAQAAGIVCLGYALLAMAHEEGTPSLRITTSQSASKLSEALNIHPDHEGSNGTPS